MDRSNHPEVFTRSFLMELIPSFLYQVFFEIPTRLIFQIDMQKGLELTKTPFTELLYEENKLTELIL